MTAALKAAIDRLAQHVHLGDEDAALVLGAARLVLAAQSAESAVEVALQAFDRHKEFVRVGDTRTAISAAMTAAALFPSSSTGDWNAGAEAMREDCRNKALSLRRYGIGDTASHAQAVHCEEIANAIASLPLPRRPA